MSFGDEGLPDLVRRRMADYAKSVAPAVVELALVSDGQAHFWPEERQRHRFHIGSVTKVFTGLLLADMVAAGQITMPTSVGEVFDVKGPARRITLGDLATQSPGWRACRWRSWPGACAAHPIRTRPSRR